MESNPSLTYFKGDNYLYGTELSCHQSIHPLNTIDLVFSQKYLQVLFWNWFLTSVSCLMNVCLPVLESAVDLGIFFQLLDHKMAFINAFHFICGTLFHLLDHKYHWLVLFCLHVCANLFVSQRFCLISLGDFIELIIEMY